MVVGIDDEAPVSLLRLFNEPAGQDLPWCKQGVPEALVLSNLNLLGISCVIANLLSARLSLPNIMRWAIKDVVVSVPS